MKMKILLDGRGLQPGMDGIGRFITAVSGRLCDLRPDWDLTLLVSPGSSRHVATRGNLEIVESPVPRFRPGERRKLAKAALAARPDACLCFSMAGPVWEGEPLRCPTSFVVHDTMVLELEGYFSANPFSDMLMRTWFRRLVRRSAKGAAAIAVPTRRVEADLCRLLPAARGKTLVVYEGQDMFAPGRTEGPGRGGFLLYVGNARIYKNLERILKAYAMAAESSDVPDLVMVVRRDRAFAGFERMLERSGVAGRIRLCSDLPDERMRELYSTCTAFVSPSVWEGFGLPVLEAMAAGCPVIASRGTALEEVAGDGALLVDPLDTPAISRAIVEICSNLRAREELSARAVSRAALFGWDSTAVRMAEMLERTVKD